jgi:hypothetical protein
MSRRQRELLHKQQLASKIHPGQAHVEHAGHRFKHVVISLKNQQSIAETREKPDRFAAIQADLSLRLRRGDSVTIISPCGNHVAESLPVIRAEGGSVQLGKPLRMVELAEIGLFDNGFMRVVPAGTGYSIETVRDGATDPKVYETAKAAEQEILRRQPVQVT